MLYIMRYGKTDCNVQHKLQGRIDIPNNEKYMKNVQNTYVKLFLYANNVITRCVNNYTTTFSG